MDYEPICIALGMATFLFAGFWVIEIAFPSTYDVNLEQLRQAEQDCLVKEYYYMDDHREFCDRIGVTP